MASHSMALSLFCKNQESNHEYVQKLHKLLENSKCKKITSIYVFCHIKEEQIESQYVSQPIRQKKSLRDLSGKIK